MGQLDDRYVDARSYVKSQQHEDNADIGFPAFDKHLFEDAVVFFTGKPVYTHAGREADAARYTPQRVHNNIGTVRSCLCLLTSENRKEQASISRLLLETVLLAFSHSMMRPRLAQPRYTRRIPASTAPNNNARYSTKCPSPSCYRRHPVYLSPTISTVAHTRRYRTARPLREAFSAMCSSGTSAYHQPRRLQISPS
jgi:hypothetical protein